MTRRLKISIDHGADAAYVALSEAQVVRTEEVAHGIMIDYDREDRPVGVEILAIKARVGTSDPDSYLRGLAEGVLAPGRQAAE